MGAVGDCFDNPRMESFWGTMQVELLDVTAWQSRAELAAGMFEWIGCWYRPFRRHSSIGMLSPVTFEEQHKASQTGR
jgi:putative transposase